MLAKYASDQIATMSLNEPQRSVNDVCAGILDNIAGMECRKTTMNLTAAFIAKNASVDITSASYNFAPMVRLGS